MFRFWINRESKHSLSLNTWSVTILISSINGHCSNTVGAHNQGLMAIAIGRKLKSQIFLLFLEWLKKLKPIYWWVLIQKAHYMGFLILLVIGSLVISCTYHSQ